MEKIAAFIASGSGMGADAALHLSSKGFKIAIMSSSGKGEKLANTLNGLGYTGSNLIKENLEEFESLGVQVQPVKKEQPKKYMKG